MPRRLLACPSWAFCSLLACAPSPQVAQVPSLVVALPDPPPPPEHGLPVVPLGDAWTPARTIAGDLEGLREALAGVQVARARVAARLMAPGQQEPLRAALQQLAPEAAWTVEVGPWHDAVVGVPSLERLDGRPRDAAPSYPTTGLSSQDTTETTTVVIGDAPVDLTAWRALPAASSGSCEPVFEALALSQEQSLAYVEPFLDHADTALRLQFRAGLAQVLPELQARLEPYARPEPQPDASPAEAEAHACGHALHARVQEAARCSRDACTLAPRMVLRGGAAVVMPAPPWSPGDCGDRVPLEVEEILQSVATEATVATLSRLEPRWVTLADRVGAIGAVYEALDDLCSPRRRRFTAEDLADARARLGRVERALASDVLDESGRWDVALGSLFVPGVGPTVSVATFRPGAGASQTAIAGAKGVRRFLLSRSLCRSGYAELPLAVAVFEPGSRTPRFAGYVYDETLVCADLPLP